MEWFAIQPLFLNSKADVLFLLDCCAAASAATTSINITGTKQTIAACGFEAQAPEPGAHSFTNELIKVLDRWQNRPFSVGMLHNELLVNLKHPKPQADMFGKVVESRRTPVHWITTSDVKAPSIVITRRQSISNTESGSPPPKRRRTSTESTSSDSKDPMVTPPTSEHSNEPLTLPDIDKYAPDQLNRVLSDGNLAIPHVLVSLALEGEQLLEIGAWDKWLKACPAFVKLARVEGMYRSRSTLLVLSLPVAIWDLLPPDLACSFIGYVDSVNQITMGTCEESSNLQTCLTEQKSVTIMHEDDSHWKSVV